MAPVLCSAGVQQFVGSEVAQNVNADVSKAKKLGVDRTRLASSLTKKKEEPTT